MAISVKQKISSIFNRLFQLRQEREDIEKRTKQLFTELTDDMDTQQINSLKDHINSL